MAVLVYYPSAVLIGFALTMMVLFLHRRKHWKLGRGKTIILFLFFTYVVMLLYITYFSREPGSRTGIDLQLFGTWNLWAQSRAYFFENIILFIPFGLCMPVVWKRMRNPVFLFLLSGMTSVSIEMLQYFTQRGFCQLDDVVTNVLGALLGWMCWCLAFFIVPIL